MNTFIGIGLLMRLFFVSSLLLAMQATAAPMWSNKTKGGDDYLVGTIHLGDERFHGLPSQLLQAIDAVDVVILELDLSKVSPQEQQRVTFKYGMLPAGTTLEQTLSPDVYQQAQQYLAQQGFDIRQFTQFKPWMLGLTMVQIAYVRQGMDISNGIDKQIADYASLQGKKIIGLETFEKQMSFFDDIFKLDAAISNDDLILDTLTELREHKDMPSQMLEAWLKGNMAAFETIYKDTLGQSEFDKAAEKVLLTDRNHRWVKQLKPMLKQQKVLVAVGTLHFAGSEGLTKLFGKEFTQLHLQ